MLGNKKWYGFKKWSLTKPNKKKKSFFLSKKEMKKEKKKKKTITHGV